MASRLAVLLLLGATLAAGARADLLEKARGVLGDLRPKAASAPAPAAAPEPAAQPAAAAGKAAKPESSTVMVGRKRVTLSSAELDKHCDRVVVPFALNANLADLTALAAAGASESLPGFLSGGAKDKQMTASKHQISRSVRERALKLNWMPMSLEKRYGRTLHDQAVTAGDLVERESVLGKRLYPKADALLAALLGGVKQEHPYKFELHIRKANEDNAIALPGGIVYLDAGLLRDANPAKARFALAHELSHVLRRHETRIAQARIIDTISLTGSTSDLVRVLKDPSAISAGVLKSATVGHKVFQQHYADQELQSDSCAVRVLNEALDDNRDVEAAIASFIASLQPDASSPSSPGAEKKQAGAGNAGVVALGGLVKEVSNPIDRHPSSRERVDNLNAMRTLIHGLSAAKTMSGKP
jgi:Zn-dependent protease with chaperone function